MEGVDDSDQHEKFYYLSSCIENMGRFTTCLLSRLSMKIRNYFDKFKVFESKGCNCSEL